MDSSVLIESFAEFAKFKNIDRPTMIRILEDVFRTMIRKKYVTDENFDVIINLDKGDLEIWRYREIVADNADVWDPNDKDDDFEFDENLHIKITDAKKIEEDFEIGEEVAEEVKFEEMGRRLVLTARQTLIQKVKDLEKDILFSQYKELVGEIITAEVYQILSREVLLIDDDGNELALPKGEQIPKDRFRKGDTARAIVHRAEMNNGNPKIILSRTSPEFLERLFEAEVPEVFDGLIAIKRVVREPGERAKVAVESLLPLSAHAILVTITIIPPIITNIVVHHRFHFIFLILVFNFATFIVFFQSSVDFQIRVDNWPVRLLHLPLDVDRFVGYQKIQA